MGQPKIFVVKPTFGAEDRDHGRCKTELIKLGVPVLELEDCPYIDMARAALVEMAFKEEPDLDVMIWIDHDIIFQAGDVVKLAQHCWESEYDILAVLYSMRRPNFTTIGRPTKESKRVEFYTPGLVDADIFGLGFTAIKAHVFHQMRETLPLLYCPTVGRDVRPYFSHALDDNAYLGEDISFWYRAKKLGFRAGIDTEFRIFHRGKYDYALEDSGLAVPDLNPLVINFSNDIKRKIESDGVSDITQFEVTPVLQSTSKAAE